jgi:hypothetical protein
MRSYGLMRISWQAVAENSWWKREAEVNINTRESTGTKFHQNSLNNFSSA